MSEANHELCIERLHHRYLIPSGDPVPAYARNLSEDAVAQSLSDALENVLRHAFVPDDPSLWFIPRLEVGFPLNQQIEESRVPELCAMEIAAELLDALDRQDDGIVRFANDADFLAHFLLDLAAGSAWNKWYYADFDGLRSLSISAAIRTAVCDRPEVSRDAFNLLSEAQCATLARALSSADADRIMSALACSSPQDHDGCFEAISHAWSDALFLPAEDDIRRALVLFLSCCRHDKSLSSEELRASAIATARLFRCLYERPDKADEILSALRDCNLHALMSSVGFQSSQVIAPCLSCPSDALEGLLQRVSGRPSTNPQTRRETRFTAFGGAFLLLPLLDEFPFESIAESWPEVEEIDPAILLRLVVLAKCLGAQRARGCLQDPLLRDFLATPPQMDSSQIADWLDALTPAHLQTLLVLAAKWNLELGAINAETFVFIQPECVGSRITILLESLRGTWLFAAPTESGVAPATFLFSELPQPGQLLCDDSCSEFAGLFPQSQIRSLAGTETIPGLRLSKLASDLEYLSLPRELCPSPEVDAALSVIAQSILRRFAWKLPGFALSSLEYLFNNFLDCSAAVESAMQQQTICLGRPPLHLVLGIAGLNRCSYRLSWLPDSTCFIFPEA